MTVQKTQITDIAVQQAYQAHANATAVRPSQPGGQKFAVDGAQGSAKAEDVITPDERRFFQELFPTSATEIGDHHAYRRDGSRVALSTGTVVDRKG